MFEKEDEGSSLAFGFNDGIKISMFLSELLHFSDPFLLAGWSVWAEMRILALWQKSKW